MLVGSGELCFEVPDDDAIRSDAAWQIEQQDELGSFEERSSPTEICALANRRILVGDNLGGVVVDDTRHVPAQVDQDLIEFIERQTQCAGNPSSRRGLA